MRKFNRIMRLNVTLDEKRNLIQAIKLPVEGFHRNIIMKDHNNFDVNYRAYVNYVAYNMLHDDDYDPCCDAVYGWVNGIETLVGIQVQHPYVEEEYTLDGQYLGYRMCTWNDYYDFRVCDRI